MSVTLTTPAKNPAGASDATVSATTARLNFVSGDIQAAHAYGNGVDAAFIPDPTVAAMNINFNLITGVLTVNGAAFMVSGVRASIAAADLTAIIAAFTTAQNAVDTALVNAKVLSGTVG